MLDHFLAYCEKAGLTQLDKITIFHFQAFVNDNPADSERTRHHRAQVLKGFLNWCSTDEAYTGVRYQLVRKLEMPKVHETEVVIFTPEEIDRLLVACQQTRWKYRNMAIINLLLETGIRASECCYNPQRAEEGEPTGLAVESVVLGRKSAGHIHVLWGKSGKHGCWQLG
jgi:integrase